VRARALQGRGGWTPRARSAAGARTATATLWLPLTDATPGNGCIYAVPARWDDAYRAVGAYRALCGTLMLLMRAGAGSGVGDFDLQCVRALPVPAGQPLLWSGRLIHWGGRAAREYRGAPRVSVAWSFAARDFERAADRIPHARWPLAEPPPLAARLFAVATQLHTYAHRVAPGAQAQAVLAALEDQARAADSDDG
jgi:hypothetical protein